MMCPETGGERPRRLVVLGGGPNEAAKYRWTKRAENYGRKIGPAVRAYAERVYEITNTIPLFR